MGESERVQARTALSPAHWPFQLDVDHRLARLAWTQLQWAVGNGLFSRAVSWIGGWSSGVTDADSLALIVGLHRRVFVLGHACQRQLLADVGCVVWGSSGRSTSGLKGAAHRSPLSPLPF